MNVWDLVIIAVIAAALVFAVRHVVKNRGKNCYGCTCDCEGCEYAKKSGRGCGI